MESEDKVWTPLSEGPDMTSQLLIMEILCSWARLDAQMNRKAERGLVKESSLGLMTFDCLNYFSVIACFITRF